MVVSYQMVSYNKSLRKSIKWYRKISLEMFIRVAIVCGILRRKDKNQNIKIPGFQERVIMELLETKTKITENEDIILHLLRARKLS